MAVDNDSSSQQKKSLFLLEKSEKKDKGKWIKNQQVV